MELGDITFILFLAVAFLLFQNSKNRKNIEKLMNPQMYSKSYSLDISVSDAVGKIIKDNPNINLIKNKENLEVYNRYGSHISLTLLYADNMWAIKSRSDTSFAEYKFSDVRQIYGATLLYFNEPKTKKLDYLHELQLAIYQRIDKQVEGMPPPEPYLSICLVEYDANGEDSKADIIVSVDLPIGGFFDLTKRDWRDIDDGLRSLYCGERKTVFGTKEYFAPGYSYEKEGITVSYHS